MHRSIILLVSALAFLLPAIGQAGPLPVRLGTEVPPPLVPPHSWPVWNFSPGNASDNYYEHTLTLSNVKNLTLHPLPTTVQGGGVIANGLAFLGNSFGLQAITLSSGEVRWTWPHVLSIMMTDGAVVYVAGNPACSLASPAAVFQVTRTPADCPITDLVALDNQTGALRWDLPISPTLFCCEGLHLARGRLYFGVQPPGGGTPSLEAVDTRTGQMAWQVPVAGLGAGAYGTYRGHPVFYVIAGPAIQALDAITGRVLGTLKAPSRSGTPSEVLYADGWLYVNTVSHLLAFGDQGRRLWTAKYPTCRLCLADYLRVAGDGVVYVYEMGAYGGAFHGFDAATGKQLSAPGCDVPQGRQCGSMVLANGLLYLGGDEQGGYGVLTIDDAYTGQEVANYVSPTLGQDLYPEVVDGVVYMFGGAGSSGYFSLN